MYRTRHVWQPLLILSTLKNAYAHKSIILYLISSFCTQTRRVCYRFSTGVTEAGKKFDTFVATLIVLNVVAVIAESEPSIGNNTGPWGATIQRFFDVFEVNGWII